MPDNARPTAKSADEWLDESEYFTTSRGHRVCFRQKGEGSSVMLLHGFPTWSYDYVGVTPRLEEQHHVVTLDFLGYGGSDKPSPYAYSVTESADIVEELSAHLGIGEAHLVIHDYGAIVGQELADRTRRGTLSFEISTLTVLNAGIVYSAYRPTPLQRLLARPIVGPLLARRISPGGVRSGLNGVRGNAKLTDDEFAELWKGIQLSDGHRLAHHLIGYNAERDQHHDRWESAVADLRIPVQLVWGLADPVSGAHVLERARESLPAAHVEELPGVGHFPAHEAPSEVAEAIVRFTSD